MSGARRRSRDDGTVLMLMCVGMWVLIIIVAIVIDLGFGQTSKRDSQSVVDLAALDAGYYLSGQGPNPFAISEPRKGCVAAVQSVQRNSGAFASYTTSAINTACSSLPATAALCVDNAPVDVVLTSGESTLTIRYPVPGAELVEARFDTTGAEDGTDPCERMKVEVTGSNQTMFASMMGTDEIEHTASAVVRGTTSAVAQTPPAVLLLERTDCGVFGNSVSGNGNLGIIVEAHGSEPGLIHADSNATTNCSGNAAGAYAIYGSPLSSGGPSITVGNVVGPPARLGAIRTNATNGKGAATFPGGLSTSPSVGEVVSRYVVDDKYNSVSNPAIKNLHADAAALVMPTSAPAGYKVIGCGDPTGSGTAGASKLYINCASVNGNVTFTGYTEVVFGGDVNLGNGETFSFPAATTIVVRGKMAVNAGRLLAPSVRNLYVGAGVDVKNGGALAVNSTTETSCAGREGPAWTSTTRMAVFSGTTNAFMSAGNVALCQTTVYLAGPKTAAYAVQQTTTGGTCTAFKPCPKVTGNTATFAQFDLTGGTALWSAPNQYANAVPENVPQGLEDLALWTEGAGASNIGNGSILLATGVYFAPNSDYGIRSPATGQPRDAQFVARKAWVYQGTLRVQPQKANSITVPMPGAYSLIR